MKYRVEWWQRVNKKPHSKRQSVVFFNEEDVLHFVTNLEQQDGVSTVDVIPVMGD